MKRNVRIFIGSSSENKKIVRGLCNVIRRSRPKIFKADVAPWDKGVFKHSATYIESLEKELDRADFAILVLTPNDVTLLRDEVFQTPRDNVQFELGLFMGRLRRECCFMIYSRDDAPKRPTDLLGIKAVTYREAGSKGLEKALSTPAREILNHIAEVLAATGISSFVAQIEGQWCERISTRAAKEVSFFNIRPTNKYQSVEMRGDHFDAQGELIGSWKSIDVGIRPDERALFYHWAGEHPPSEEGDASQVEGFGAIEFKNATGRINSGKGGFLDVDRSRTSEAQWKTVRLKRITNEAHLRTIEKGSLSAKKALVGKLLRNW
jgi:hypothetical protein